MCEVEAVIAHGTATFFGQRRALRLQAHGRYSAVRPEAEIPGSLEDAIELAEAYLRFLSAEVLTRCGRHLGRLSHIVRFLAAPARLPRVPLSDAVSRLGHDPELVADDSLTREGDGVLARMTGGWVWLADGSTAELLLGGDRIVSAAERRAAAEPLRARFTLDRARYLTWLLHHA